MTTASKTKRTRPPSLSIIKEALIAYFFERDGGSCAFCGGPLLEPPKLEPAWSGKPPQGGVEIDHILPLSRGGENRLVNLRLLHKSCNVRIYSGPIELERYREKKRKQWREFVEGKKREDTHAANRSERD